MNNANTQLPVSEQASMLLRILPWRRKQNAGNEEKPRARSIMAGLLSILYILYSLEVGLFLLCLPWMDIWENNYLLYLYPQIRPIVANWFFKGGVLGLGIANILIGIHEILNLRKILKGCFSR